MAAFRNNKVNKAIKAGKNTIRDILRNRANECSGFLESIVGGFLETPADHAMKVGLLYEYFALKRYLEGTNE